MAKVKLSGPDRQWEIEDAVRTLQRAEAIRKDKALMQGVKQNVTALNKMVMGGSSKAPTKSIKKK